MLKGIHALCLGVFSLPSLPCSSRIIISDGNFLRINILLLVYLGKNNISI